MLLAVGLLWAACNASPQSGSSSPSEIRPLPRVEGEQPVARIPVTQDVTIRSYFTYIDALVARYDAQAPYELTEHLLVLANPWIIDSLAATDYYVQKGRGVFVEDQRDCIVLRAGDTLQVPGPRFAAQLQEALRQTVLDVNIPAFRLRVLQNDSVVLNIPVRVGKNKSDFLQMVGREVDLRTRTGEGRIIMINRDPTVYDPVTGKKYHSTKRDDQGITKMPRIPWLETEIDGIRNGQMIHPTTNPNSLGKPASNGCIGMGEADAWRVYYHAPIGTRVRIRYDLQEVTPQGDTLRFNDVYQMGAKATVASLFPFRSMRPLESLCHCDPML